MLCGLALTRAFGAPKLPTGAACADTSEGSREAVKLRPNNTQTASTSTAHANLIKILIPGLASPCDDRLILPLGLNKPSAPGGNYVTIVLLQHLHWRSE